jgi:hypothetical protein
LVVFSFVEGVGRLSAIEMDPGGTYMRSLSGTERSTCSSSALNDKSIERASDRTTTTDCQSSTVNIDHRSSATVLHCVASHTTLSRIHPTWRQSFGASCSRRNSPFRATPSLHQPPHPQPLHTERSLTDWGKPSNCGVRNMACVRARPNIRTQEPALTRVACI